MKGGDLVLPVLPAIPLAGGLAAVLPSASQQVTSTLTLANVMTETTTALTGFVPDLGIFIAAGVVLALVAVAGRKLIKAGR